MLANEIKRGARVLLRNGWQGEMADNMKGLTRMVKVFGDYTEIGSVYTADIAEVSVNGFWEPVELSPAQQKQDAKRKAWLVAMGMA